MSGFLSSITSALGNLFRKLWWKPPPEPELEPVPVFEPESESELEPVLEPESESEPEPESEPELEESENESEASEYGTANERSDEEDDSKDESEDDPKDLDIKVPWPVPFSDNENHQKVWQRGIKKAKDMLRVDGAEYFFSTWFAKIPSKELTNLLLTAKSEKEVAEKLKELWSQNARNNEIFKRKIQRDIESLIQKYKSEDKGSPEWISSMEEEHEGTKLYNADMTAERVKGILDAIDNDRFLIRVKFIWEDKDGFKIVDKYEPIRESKKAGKKFVPGGRNVILTKKTNPGF